MKRKDEIEYHLSALEAPATNERLADWERALVCKYRIQFDRTGDLNDREYEALEKLRHRASPPKLGSNGADKVLAVVHGKADAMMQDCFRQMIEKESGMAVVQFRGRTIEIQWATSKPAVSPPPPAPSESQPMPQYFGTVHFWKIFFRRQVPAWVSPWYIDGSGECFFAYEDTTGPEVSVEELQRRCLSHDSAKLMRYRMGSAHPDYYFDRIEHRTSAQSSVSKP